jgi:hypothetical protein
MVAIKKVKLLRYALSGSARSHAWKEVLAPNEVLIPSVRYVSLKGSLFRDRMLTNKFDSARCLAK